jgi:hypothetical protein
MSQLDFYAILDECVARLRQGESLEACLNDYPEQAAELNPALAVSANLLELPRLEAAPEIVAQGFEAMMDAVVPQEQPSLLAGLLVPFAELLSPLKPQKVGGLTIALRAAMLFLIMFAVSSVSVISASADSLPGDALYPVKRSWESTRLALTLAEPSRQALESKFAEQRREEVQALLSLGRPVVVEFQGQLESTGDGLWLVEGLSLEINDDTVYSGAIIVGATVIVQAQVSPDGTLLALEIRGEKGEMPDSVEPTKIPEPTRTPEPTREPEPTDKPTPTDEPTRRPTHEPTETMEKEPTREKKPTATREPEPTRTPLSDIKPTEEHRPTEPPHDEPTATPKPKDEPTREKETTPRPTEIHEPTATKESPPEPTATHEPEPTATEKPTREPEPTATKEQPPEPTATYEPEPTSTSESAPEPEPTLEPTPAATSTKQIDASDGLDPP